MIDKQIISGQNKLYEVVSPGHAPKVARTNQQTR